MLTVHFGVVGFHCKGGTVKGLIGTSDENKEAKIFMLFLGLVGFTYWNPAGMRIYMRCLRLSVSDAELIADARRLINERVEARIKEDMAKEREDNAFWTERNTQERYRLEAEARELRGNIHRLETTIKELTRLGA